MPIERRQAPHLDPHVALPSADTLSTEAVGWACVALNRMATTDKPSHESPYELCWEGRAFSTVAVTQARFSGGSNAVFAIQGRTLHFFKTCPQAPPRFHANGTKITQSGKHPGHYWQGPPPLLEVASSAQGRRGDAPEQGNQMLSTESSTGSSEGFLLSRSISSSSHKAPDAGQEMPTSNDLIKRAAPPLLLKRLPVENLLQLTPPETVAAQEMNIA